MKKLPNPFRGLSKFEWGLWLLSVAVVTLSFVLSGSPDLLTIAASLIGITALIFVAKGYVIGQILTVAFALFYGVISFFFRYYGEMITYLCMTSPIAIMTVVSWLRHPFQQSAEVEVHHITRRQCTVMVVSAALVTGCFYFILRALGNANLLFSTISVTTSFVASYLTLYRSPFYALGYAANDVVLIVLWVLAAIQDRSYLPMVLCFVMFLVNDIYGFVNWRRMKSRQERAAMKNAASPLLEQAEG